MKKIISTLRKQERKLTIAWLLVVFISRIEFPGINQVLVISSSLLSLLALIRLSEGLREGIALENHYTIVEPVSAVFLVIGLMFRLLNWPDPNIFYFGLLTLLLSILLLFIPKIQERHLPQMKWILLRTVILLLAAFYSFF